MGVEGDDPFCLSDLDVPSVAQHEQNKHRKGFSAIVQMTAELWLRLAHKAPQLALDFVRDWRGSQYRLLRRMALFAAADRIVPAQAAADTLIEIPISELSLGGSSVEA